MKLANFFSIDAQDNIPGYNRYWFIPDDAIIYIPKPVNGYINMNNVVYKPEFDTWYTGGALFETLDLGEKENKGVQGSIYPVNIQGKTAGIIPLTLALFHEKKEGRFITIIGDNNGNYILSGEPGNGLLFSFSRDNAFLSFTYKGSYRLPSYFLSGFNPADPSEPEEPEPGSGGIVHILRTDSSAIADVAAPDSYAVPNSNLVLKNSSGQTIATDAVMAASTKQINVPDTTVTLIDSAAEQIGEPHELPSGDNDEITVGDSAITVNGEAFLNVKATHPKNILLYDDEGNVVTPTDLTDNVITVPAGSPAMRALYKYANFQ